MAAGAPSAPLRVLFLHQGSELYGSDRVLLNLAAYLASSGNRVWVVLPEEGPLAEALQDAGVGVDLVKFPVARRRELRGFGLLRFLASIPKGVSAFGKVALPFRPDVVCTNTVTTPVAGLRAWRSRVPHVWLVHEMLRGASFEGKVLARIVGHLSRLVVAPSRAVADTLAAGWPPVVARTRVVPNGIDPGPYPGTPGVLRGSLGIPADAFLVGVAGRFNRWKGQRELIPCMAEVCRREPRAAFVFAGTPFRGDEAILEDFRGRLSAARLDDRVFLAGGLRDMGSFYADLDMFVLPSVLPEPFGLVLLEAMAAGKPVAAFAHGGPLEIVDPSCGLLVPPVDQGAMAEAVLELAADPERGQAMGRAGAGRVRLLYTVERQGAAFEALLREIAGGPR